MELFILTTVMSCNICFGCVLHAILHSHLLRVGELAFLLCCTTVCECANLIAAVGAVCLVCSKRGFCLRFRSHRAYKIEYEGFVHPLGERTFGG